MFCYFCEIWVNRQFTKETTCCSSSEHTQLQPYLSPAPRCSGDISRSLGTFRRFDDTVTKANTGWCSEAGNEKLVFSVKKKKKNCQPKLRFRTKLRFLRATLRENSLCLSSMKPWLEYFKGPLLKITRSHYIPTGSHQEDRMMGLGGGRNSNTLHLHRPPKTSQTPLRICQWHGRDSRTRGDMCDWHYVVCMFMTVFPKHWWFLWFYKYTFLLRETLISVC